MIFDSFSCAGVVVTGTASTGSATVGDTLTLLPQGQEIRIRELRSNDLVSDTALAGQRVALCLAGKVNVEDINRGDCLVDATLAHQATRVDVQLSLHNQLQRHGKGFLYSFYILFLFSKFEILSKYSFLRL